MYANVEQVKMFEVLETSEMVKHQDGDDFTVGHFVFAVARFFTLTGGYFL